MNVASLLSTREDAPADALRHYRRALALREWPEATAAHAEYNAALALQSLGGASNLAAAVAALRRAREVEPWWSLLLLCVCAERCRARVRVSSLFSPLVRE